MQIASGSVCLRLQLLDELIFHLRYVNMSQKSRKWNVGKELVLGMPRISAGSLLFKLNTNCNIKCHNQGLQKHMENLLTRTRIR